MKNVRCVEYSQGTVSGTQKTLEGNHARNLKISLALLRIWDLSLENMEGFPQGIGRS